MNSFTNTPWHVDPPIEPPIMHVSGAGLTARLWREENRRDFARKHLRRKYAEGVQIAFEYFENDETIRAGLMRLAKFVWGDDQL